MLHRFASALMLLSLAFASMSLTGCGDAEDGVVPPSSDPVENPPPGKPLPPGEV
ncbi:hypothetical protein [Alienimonas californiensis]|uniref:Uncharacterized protein n=1 Tax=Alienimonas californiensis TaxID=2527989 RepID=A0A517P746_9PLAN|nr:hypothetical protein [Alienimonas californiensis]QDT15175.1 hypothetical protein CA12_12560 [Alienimonas californiensis]